MVAVNSTMLPLGTAAPDFRLPDVSGKSVSLADFKGKPLLVMFICNHCPYVKHIRAGLAQLGRDYSSRGAAIVAISSNDVENYPQDGPDKMKEEAKSAGYNFPYLFDKDHRLVYRGQFDDSRPSSGLPVTGKDLRQALDTVLAGKPVPAAQKP